MCFLHLVVRLPSLPLGEVCLDEQYLRFLVEKPLAPRIA